MCTQLGSMARCCYAFVLLRRSATTLTNLLVTQDKRVIEQFRLHWSCEGYDASLPDLTALRHDLLQQRRWGRMVCRP
jgi:hypothetical protein